VRYIRDVGLFSMMRKIVLTAMLLPLGACGGMPPVALAPTIEQAPANELPPPAGLRAEGAYVYALGPLDKISIEVDGMPDLLREVVVDGQGMVSYPLAGAVTAGGLTTTQLAQVLEARMRENHVRDPRVSVNIVEATSQVLTVDGEVNKPGLYPVYQDMTLIQAMALAGGDADFARTSAVLIFREVDGQQYVGLYDLNAIRYGNYVDPKVYPNDKIVVSESESRRFLQMVGPFVSLLTTPLIYLIRQ
jgi:polysaccharide export outer membrane protein